MAEFKEEHRKHRADDTPDHRPPQCVKSLPEAPFFSPWEEFCFTTKKCPHLAGLLPVYVTSLQYREDPDGDTVQHEV